MRDQSTDGLKERSKSPAPKQDRAKSMKKSISKPNAVEEMKDWLKSEEPVHPEIAKKSAKKSVKSKKSTFEDKPENDLGPMPKRVSNVFMMYS